MKIKLSELKQIIKEELLKESFKAYNHIVIRGKTIPLYANVDVLDYLFSNEWYNMSGDERDEAITNFAIDNNLLDYERPRHEFDESEAAQLAYDAGADGVIVNDLS